MTTNSLLHIFWCWLFIDFLDLDVIGVGIATMTSYTLNFIAITIVCMCFKTLKNTFFFFTKESFQDIKEYLIIGIPSALMLCLEWGGFELLSLLASVISVDALAA